MKIGELARVTACAVETIRYYEREGLLAPPARSSANYRLYGTAHVERLTFIRNCRALDMTHGEIRALLTVRDGAHDCSEANALLDSHIEHVSARIAELEQLKRQLLGLREQCAAPSAVAQCGILRELAEPHGGAPRDMPAAGHLGSSHRSHG